MDPAGWADRPKATSLTYPYPTPRPVTKLGKDVQHCIDQLHIRELDPGPGPGPLGRGLTVRNLSRWPGTTETLNKAQ